MRCNAIMDLAAVCEYVLKFARKNSVLKRKHNLTMHQMNIDIVEI